MLKNKTKLKRQCKYLPVFLFFLCNILPSHAQDFYLIDTTETTGLDDSRKIIDINTCTLSTTTSEINLLSVPFHPPDIIITGLSEGFNIPVSLILNTDPQYDVAIDAVTYNYWDILQSPSGNNAPFTPETLPKGMATDYNYQSYLVGNHLSHVNGIESIVTSLAILPPAQRPKGQMTFREGSFYYPSVNNELMQLKVSGANYWIRALGSLPDTIQYGGLFSIPHSCDSTSTYVIHHDPDRGSTLYLLDIPSVTLSQHCTMPYKPSAAAFDGENTLPPCDFSFDLDTNIDTTVNRYDTICTGTIALLDENIELLINLEYDSLIIEIINPLDAPDEWVEVSTTHPEVTTSNNQSTRIRLQSTGFTKGADFMEVLQSLSYTQNAAPPSAGIREIKIQVFHQFYDSLEASIFINVPDDIFNITEEIVDPSCFGLSDGSINLSIGGGTPPLVFEWEDDNSLGFNRTNLAEDNYIWAVSDAVGCVLKDTIVLIQPDTLIVNISSSQDTICGDNGSLIGLVQGGTMPYLYDWSNGNESLMISNLAADTYTLNITDTNNCTASAEYTLYAINTVFESVLLESCQGQAVLVNGQNYEQDTLFQQLLTTPEGCDSLVDYQLIFSDTFYSTNYYTLCAGENVDINGQSFNTDTILRFSFQSIQGCDSTEYHEIVVLPENSQLQTKDICAGELFEFNGVLLAQSGLYSDTLTATNGCDSIWALELTVHPLPEPIIQTNGSLCIGGSMSLSTSGYDTYLWNTGSMLSEIPITNSGEYSLQVEDSFGCEGETAISISETALVVDYHLEQPLCPEDKGSIVFDGFSGGVSPFSIRETATIIDTSSVINNLNIGQHSFTIQDVEGCQSEIEATIVSAIFLDVILPDLPPINLGESVILRPIPSFTPSNIIWSPAEHLSCNDCINPSASPLETTNYSLILENGDGCFWEGSLLLIVKNNGLYIPNIFSPNDDGVNDLFSVFPSTSVKEISSIQIFDRWGAMVFESNTNAVQWDGNIGEKQAPQTVYLYKIEWTDLNGRVFIEKGEVNLLR